MNNAKQGQPDTGCFPPPDHKRCECDHKLRDTGGAFYQSTGWIECTVCGGWQPIRKPIEV